MFFHESHAWRLSTCFFLLVLQITKPVIDNNAGVNPNRAVKDLYWQSTPVAEVQGTAHGKEALA